MFVICFFFSFLLNYFDSIVSLSLLKTCENKQCIFKRMKFRSTHSPFIRFNFNRVIWELSSTCKDIIHFGTIPSNSSTAIDNYSDPIWTSAFPSEVYAAVALSSSLSVTVFHICFTILCVAAYLVLSKLVCRRLSLHQS